MRSVLLYLFLVGTPLAGLLLILRAGERLEAPPAVGGTWAVDGAFAEAARRHCAPLDLPDDGPLLTVSQSGRYLQLRFNDAAETVLPGTLDGAALTARHTLPTGAGAGRTCGAATPAELRLRLVEEGGAARLTGRWSTPGCAACPPLPFAATRADGV